MRPEDDLRKSVGELLASARRELGPHLEPEELAAYHGGTLSAAEEARVQEHLVACPECTELLLDLEGLGDPAYASDVTATETAAAWRVVREGLKADDDGEGDREGTPAGAHGFQPGPRWALPLAASLLFAVVALSFWAASLRRTVGELSRPQLNAPVLDLQPSVRGEEPDAPVPVVLSRTRLFTLVLNPVGPPGEGVYEAEIVDAAGRRSWSGRGLQPNAFGSFSIALPARVLGAGDFRLHLYRLAGGRRELMGDYAFRIQAP